MRKSFNSFVIAILLTTTARAQICTIIDSFSIEHPNVTVFEDRLEPAGITFHNNTLWVSAGTTHEEQSLPPLVYLYQYDLTGNMIDSIGYDFGSQDHVGAMTSDDNYIWALKPTEDTLFKLDIAAKALIAAIPMGGRGSHDMGHVMTNRGDTLYFIGRETGQRFKYKKSTGTFFDMSNYTLNVVSYPSGMCAIGDSFVTTVYATFPTTLNEVSTVDPGSFSENTGSRKNWCLASIGDLTYGAGYFWQLNPCVICPNLPQYIYKIQSGLGALAINELARATDFVVAPNPVQDVINITCAASGAWESPALSLYNITGAKILAETVKNSNGKIVLDISNFNLPPGMYILEISNGMQQIRKKIAIR